MYSPSEINMTVLIFLFLKKTNFLVFHYIYQASFFPTAKSLRASELFSYEYTYLKRNAYDNATCCPYLEIAGKTLNSLKIAKEHCIVNITYFSLLIDNI